MNKRCIDFWPSCKVQVEEIQLEIMWHGPVQASFVVYHDFFTYENGIYQHSTGQLAGGHAVKIIGRAVEEVRGSALDVKKPIVEVLVLFDISLRESVRSSVHSSVCPSVRPSEV